MFLKKIGANILELHLHQTSFIQCFELLPQPVYKVRNSTKIPASPDYRFLWLLYIIHCNTTYDETLASPA